ncbi:hypothetical protein O6H91_11G071200 [Diphasiastrum complanatum]|uniref:Uncharacterized protein n=1 Tax=Diphasiastrum complanatum TaxID=34168 RepID=A0ACC2CAH0_DIPCM|nr:hypothetical protein O6H91_11G071200 [Diphasiastrum complanatum]
MYLLLYWIFTLTAALTSLQSMCSLIDESTFKLKSARAVVPWINRELYLRFASCNIRKAPCQVLLTWKHYSMLSFQLNDELIAPLLLIIVNSECYFYSKEIGSYVCLYSAVPEIVRLSCLKL